MRVLIEEGDLTTAEVDAVVNAANTDLVLGAGVAGAIRARGGPSIQAECNAHGPIGLGEAALTGSGDLPARHVIHAAALELGGSPTEQSIRSATRAALELADRTGLGSIAFPALGTGVGGFSLQRCAEIMFEEVDVFAAAAVASDGSTSERAGLQEVRFVLQGEPAYRVFEQVRDGRKIQEQLARLRQ